jgi:hypothetical protein
MSKYKTIYNSGGIFEELRKTVKKKRYTRNLSGFSLRLHLQFWKKKEKEKKTWNLFIWDNDNN